jgi:hypothetical protein
VRLVLERENFEDVLPVQTENHSADVGWDLLISDKIRLVDRSLASLLMLVRSMLAVDIGDGSLWSGVRQPASSLWPSLGWKRRPEGRLVLRGL